MVVSRPFDPSDPSDRPLVETPHEQEQIEAHTGKAIGGGPPVIEYWAKNTLSLKGPEVWKTLFHKSACLSCAWGTGGQKGGFTNEEGEKLQRCMKSMEAIIAELQPAVEPHFFEQHSIADE